MATVMVGLERQNCEKEQQKYYRTCGEDKEALYDNNISRITFFVIL